MLKFGNKEFRNLQEQVEKNMKDILFILQEEGVLNGFGIKVVGQEESADNMPTVEDYKESNPDWAYGDAYAIGTEAPYTLYILTRANGTHQNDYWFNIGSFPVAGPTGPRGPRGEVGPQGQTGNPGTNGLDAGFGTISATAETVSPTDPATVTITTSGPNTAKNISFAFDIPQGEKGKDGASEWGEIGGSLENQTDLINALQAKQNASNAVTTDGTQTISSDKTINAELKFTDSTGSSTIVNSIKTNEYGGLQILRDNGVAFTVGGSDVRFNNKNMLPANNNTTYSLGSSTAKWRDLYLSDKAYLPDIVASNHDFTFYRDNGTTPAFIIGNSSGLTTTNYPIKPRTTNTTDLGTSSYLWKDLYLSGNLTDGTNSISVANIASKDNLNFLSLDGGTMNGIITINDIDIPEKTILGDGVEVVNVSRQAKVTTHYGAGYIQQDDDENTSIRYEYNFPKKNGTFALKEDLNLEYSTNDFLGYFGHYEEPEQGYYEFHQNSKIPNGIYSFDASAVGQADKINLTFNQFHNILISPRVYSAAFTADGTIKEDGPILEICTFHTYKATYITFDATNTYVFIVFGNIIYIDMPYEV